MTSTTVGIHELSLNDFQRQSQISHNAQNGTQPFQLGGNNKLVVTVNRNKLAERFFFFFAGIARIFGAKNYGLNHGLPNDDREDAALTEFLVCLKKERVASGAFDEASDQKLPANNKLTADWIATTLNDLQKNPKYASYKSKQLQNDFKFNVDNASTSPKATKYLQSISGRSVYLPSLDNNFCKTYNSIVDAVFSSENIVDPQTAIAKLQQIHITKQDKQHNFIHLMLAEPDTSDDINQFREKTTQCMQKKYEAYSNQKHFEYAVQEIVWTRLISDMGKKYKLAVADPINKSGDFFAKLAVEEAANNLSSNNDNKKRLGHFFEMQINPDKYEFGQKIQKELQVSLDKQNPVEKKTYDRIQKTTGTIFASLKQ